MSMAKSLPAGSTEDSGHTGSETMRDVLHAAGNRLYARIGERSTTALSAIAQATG